MTNVLFHDANTQLVFRFLKP